MNIEKDNLMKTPVPLLHVSVPAPYSVCKRHRNSVCVFDSRQYTQCPFCVAQDMVNPRLKDMSSLKGAVPDVNARKQ